MPMRLAAGSGVPLYFDAQWMTLPGDVDHFNRPAGPLGTPWVDARDIWGDLFDPAPIIDSQVQLFPSHDNTFGSPPGPFQVGHAMAVRDIGVSDNFEVGIHHAKDVRGQCAPVVLADINSTDPLQMGVVAIKDLLLNGVTYMHNAFRTVVDPSDCLAPALYYRGYDTSDSAVKRFEGTEQGGWVHLPTGNWTVIRVVDGMMRMYWNGWPRGQAVPIPDWAEGRTYAGFHIIAIALNEGEYDPFLGATVQEIDSDEVTAWYWRPYDGPL